MNNFVHTHLHTYHSLLDGAGSPEERVKRAVELGMKAIVITDHNHLAGVPEFQEACFKYGIKPILGVEMYHTHNMNSIMLPKEEREKLALETAIANGVEIPKKAKKKDIAELIAPYQYDTKGYHLILIAKNQTGWNNLVKIQSISAEKGLFNGRYHCDNELLKKYSEGVMVTTACIGSMVCSYLRNNEYDKAKKELEAWIDIFGIENTFIEIQGLEWQEQFRVNTLLIELAKETNVKILATNDVHYTYKEDYDDHDTMLCIGIGKLKKDENRMRYDHEFWMKDYNEMIEGFARCGGNDEEYMSIVKQALENTNLLANMVDENIKLGSDKDLFPVVELPEGHTAETWLNKQCWDKLYVYLVKKGLASKRRIYEKRLRDELKVINKKGFASYMLTVQDAIAWGDKNGCPFGPGRGSGAGSLVLFLLGIVKGTDPVEYNLLFSRFLTEDRTSPPDIDSDASYTGRQKLLNYIDHKYGHEYVSQVGTLTRLGVKNGLKDVGRVLDIPFSIMNEVTKTIDQITDEAPGIKFKHLDALANGDNKDIEKYEQFKALENKYTELFRLARKFEGTPRNMGIHAGGVLITPMPINNIFPTKMVDGRKVTIWDKDVVEMFKGIKFDFLGLKTVSVIDLALKFISESIGEEITLQDMYENVSLNDEGYFSMICDKQTDALFQIESDLFKGIISDMQPNNINDIIALTSIGRPGPLSAEMDKRYNNRKNGLEDIIYPLKGLEDILEDSYGTIIYQEHCMLIAKKIAGFDDNQADTYLRKALAKGKKEPMELCRQWLIYGKRNTKAPIGYDADDKNQVMYDEAGKYGAEILGAINNGYTEEELIAFWDMLKDYASYLFNKSHATSYSLLTVITAYLKKYYPVEFFAALLSIQDNEDKRANYIKVIEKMGIEVSTPDINISKRDFTPLAEENKILYGLGSIKGVGEASIDAIIENTPYNTLEEIVTKLDKKVLNKRVGLALIKSGALKRIETNRFKLINEFYTIRKDKDELLDESLWSEQNCIEFETNTLGAPITCKPWFENVQAGETITIDKAELVSVREKIDKRGNLMGFVTLKKDGCTINTTVFSRVYCNNAEHFDVNFISNVTVSGKKDERGGFIINKVICSCPKANDLENDLNDMLNNI